MAHASDSNRNKAFWLTLAQSWMRLAEHVARAELASAAGYNTCVDDVQSLALVEQAPGECARGVTRPSFRRLYRWKSSIDSTVPLPAKLPH